MSSNPATQNLEILILARLSGSAASGKRRDKIQQSLEPYVKHALSQAEWRELFERTLANLAQQGHITEKPLALTDAGKRRLCEVLGVKGTALPGWETLLGRHLVARALDMPASDKVLARLVDRDRKGLQSALLKRHYKLPTPEAPSITQALDALVWRQLLGIETSDKLTLGKLRAHVLAQLLGVEPKVRPEKLPDQAAAQTVASERADLKDMRVALMRSWIFGSPRQPGSQPEPQPAHQSAPAQAAPLPEQQPAAQPAPAPAQPAAPVDLGELARQVNAQARAAETGRFGDRKVFIAAVWERMKAQPICAGMTMEQFKELLVQANRAELVRLLRADLVAAMPADLVAASAIPYLTTVFHFIEIEPQGTP